jgi:hypothetical protein
LLKLRRTRRRLKLMPISELPMLKALLLATSQPVDKSTRKAILHRPRIRR